MSRDVFFADHVHHFLFLQSLHDSENRSAWQIELLGDIADAHRFFRGGEELKDGTGIGDAGNAVAGHGQMVAEEFLFVHI